MAFRSASGGVRSAAVPDDFVVEFSPLGAPVARGGSAGSMNSTSYRATWCRTLRTAFRVSGGMLATVNLPGLTQPGARTARRPSVLPLFLHTAATCLAL